MVTSTFPKKWVAINLETRDTLDYLQSIKGDEPMQLHPTRTSRIQSILYVTDLDRDRMLTQSMPDTYFDDHKQKKCSLPDIARILEQSVSTSWDDYERKAHCGYETLGAVGHRQLTSDGDWCAWFYTQAGVESQVKQPKEKPAEYIVVAVGDPARIPWPRNMPRPLPQHCWSHDEWKSSKAMDADPETVETPESENDVPVYEKAFHGDIISNVGLHTILQEALEDFRIPTWSRRWDIILGYDSLDDAGKRSRTPNIMWTFNEKGMWETTRGGFPWKLTS